MLLIPLEQLKFKRDTVRTIREAHLIQKAKSKTVESFGMNRRLFFRNTTLKCL